MRDNAMERLVTVCRGFLLGGDLLSFGPMLSERLSHGAVVDAEVIGNVIGALRVCPLSRVLLFEIVP